MSPRGIIPLGGALVPPTRFRLWKAGDNPGDFGSNVVNETAAARVLGKYEQRGAALAIDFQHATNPKANPDYDPADPPPMAGYAELKVERTELGPEIWIDPVRWSDCGRPFAAPGKVCCGRHQIETGQRNYISPDWMVDPTTREPISLERLSLVAEPGTYHVNMLAARASANTGTITMNDLEILKALLAAAMACSSCSDADCQSMGVAVAKGVQDLATAKGLDLSGAPASQAAAVAAAAGACDPPENKIPVTAAAVTALTQPDIEKMVASAVAKMGVTAGKAMSAEDVRGIFAEDTERRTLLESNKDVLGGMLPLLASKPLSEVKSFVTAALAQASKGKDGAAPRGAPIGEPETATARPVSLAAKYAPKK